jgi:hypothetical protein
MNMKYFACNYDIFGEEPREEYYEIGDDGYATRQVYVFPHAVVTSRRDHDILVGGTLCDQPFDLWDTTGLVEVSKSVFEEMWNKPDPREDNSHS